MKKNIRVVKVIDEYKLVINVGSADGISMDQRFLVYENDDEEIFDPDTKESLGFIELVKGTGKVIHVQEKMSTIESCVYTSSPVKTVHKNPLFGSYAGYTETTESNRQQVPFDCPKTGDFAKRV